jgi:protein-S-isoprenylcysteine O-methyltransferase Ste14
VKNPTLPHLILLFFLGGAFLHFMQAGARTFYYTTGDAGPGAALGQGTFLFGGVIPVWFLGVHRPIHLANGIAAAALLVGAIGLYEWARHINWGRRFGLGWGDHVPEELCEHGPYRLVRHPIYLSYMIAFLASFVALPHWLTALMVVFNAVLFAHAARDDEQRIAQSPLAAAYAQYRTRVGMFFPRVSAIS